MKRAPRVLLCCEHYPPSVGGVQEVMRQIAERLASQGVEVTVATSVHPGRSLDAEREGVRVVSFPITGNLVHGLVGPVEDYRAFVREGNFDSILVKAAQQWTFDAMLDVLTEIRARKLFIPCGFSGLSDPRYADYFSHMPEWLRLFDGLIFYAEDYQDIRYARKHGLRALHHVPNGVDEREFLNLNDRRIRERLGIPADHQVILSVGSQIAGKGHWEVLRAFGLATFDRPTTLVVNANSPGSSVARIKRCLKHAATRRWPLSWLARWHGRHPNHKRIMIVDLPRADLVDLYKTADLFVLASHLEYSPLVLFEAAASGTPFIASSAGNSSEIARWTGGGVILPSSSPYSAELAITALAAQMGHLLSDPARLAAMGQAGRAAVFDRGFTWERIARLYQQLLLPPLEQDKDSKL